MFSVSFNKRSHNFPQMDKMFSKVDAMKYILLKDNNYIKFITIYITSWIFQYLCHV